MKLTPLRFNGLLLALCVASNAQDTLPVQETSQIQPLSFDVHSVQSAKERIPRNAVQLQKVEFIVPELILGGEWTSTIRLTNRGTTSIPSTEVYFVDNLGKPMSTAFQTTGGNVVTGTGFSFSLGVGSIVEATFSGGADTRFGFALIDLCPVGGAVTGACISGLYAETTLRNRNASRPDFEAVFPLEEPAALQYMLWDNRNGLSTILYLVNANTTPTSVTLDFVNSSNRLIRSVNVNLRPAESQILTLHVLAPEIVGLQGTLVIRGQNSAGAAIVATGLRINPSNSFTPMRAFILP